MREEKHMGRAAERSKREQVDNNSQKENKGG